MRRIGCRQFQGHPSVYHDKLVPRTVAARIPNAFAVGEATGVNWELSTRPRL